MFLQVILAKISHSKYASTGPKSKLISMPRLYLFFDYLSALLCKFVGLVVEVNFATVLNIECVQGQ